MIPTGDHSSRSIVHGRVSSWASWSEAGTTTNRDEESESLGLLSQELSRPLLPELEYEDSDDGLISIVSEYLPRTNWRLWLVFLALVLSGVSNVVLAKLQAVPMYNYPTFLNVYANGMFVFIYFCYIFPVSYFGWFHNSIPASHLTTMSKKPFMVMGFLDAMAGAMQVLATVYLPGTLIVLLPQVAIPLSMIASRFILRERFTQYQYLGAAIVMVGIVVVLFPVLTQQTAPNFSCQPIDEDHYCTICQTETNQDDCESHRRDDTPSFEWMLQDEDVDFYCKWISKEEALRHDDWLKVVWSLILVFSCVPMVLSTVYKQVALQVQLDPILINGWVSLFQLVAGLCFVVPAGYASSPKVKAMDLPENWSQAIHCMFSRTNSIRSGCHPDDCSEGALWVHLGLLSSVIYTISMILVLKYGSASLLYLGLTVMVPLGHLVFSFHSSSETDMADITGLIVLVSGLILFRFGHDEGSNEDEDRTSTGYTRGVDTPDESRDDGSNPLLAPHGHSQDKNGFLEFLREPFMMIGDI